MPQKQQLRDFSENGRVKTSELKPFVANLVLLSSNKNTYNILPRMNWVYCSLFCLCFVFLFNFGCGIGKVGQLSFKVFRFNE